MTIQSVSLIDSMKACEQMPGLSVLDHGIMVRDYYRDLIGHIRNGKALEFTWRLPDWIHDPRLLKDLPCDEVMENYHLFHDCGKPHCRTVDEEGRQHFPNHAEVSRDIWLSLGGDARIADLIGMDTQPKVAASRSGRNPQKAATSKLASRTGRASISPIRPAAPITGAT